MGTRLLKQLIFNFQYLVLMVKNTMSHKTSFFNLTLSDLEQNIALMGGRPAGAKSLFKTIYRENGNLVDAEKDISKTTYKHFQQNFSFTPCPIIKQHKSVDGSHKFLTAVGPHSSVESVLIPSKQRWTLCLSSQVGCAMECSFCHTAKQGLSKNLTVAEILSQYINARTLLREGQKITNIVFMGQGEPLHNFKNLSAAIDILSSDFGIGLGKNSISVSTVGIVPMIDKLALSSKVNLAVSLHSGFNEVRDIIAPINIQYPIEELLEACERYVKIRNGKILFEYVMLAGINDSQQDIERLAQIIKPSIGKINLIPFNPHTGSQYKCPSMEKMRDFQNSLSDRGLVTTLRETKGRDIMAACGQLNSKMGLK